MNTVVQSLPRKGFSWEDPSQGFIAFLSPSPDRTIITDACLLGSGAHMDGHASQASWMSWETRIHINLLDLGAAREAFRVL